MLLTSVLAITSSCFEFSGKKDKNLPRTITGRLLQSCNDSTPVANTELTLEYREFLSLQTQTTTTDEDGTFTFQFKAEDWHEGGLYGPYFARLTTNHSFVIEGIKPQHKDVGTLFDDSEERSLIKVLYKVDLTPLLMGDSLSVTGKRYSASYLPGVIIMGTDTAQAQLCSIDNPFPTLHDYAVWLQWRVYNSDTLRLWGTHKAKLDNQCQEFVETELVIK